MLLGGGGPDYCIDLPEPAEVMSLVKAICKVKALWQIPAQLQPE